MELMGKEYYYLRIMGPDATWLRYVDYVFVLVPGQVDLDEKLKHLNAVEDGIQFIPENEEHSTTIRRCFDYQEWR